MSSLNKTMANEPEYNNNSINNNNNKYNDDSNVYNDDELTKKNKESKFRVTIEPYLFIAIFGMMLTYLTMQNLMLDKACRINLNISGKSFSNYSPFIVIFFVRLQNNNNNNKTTTTKQQNNNNNNKYNDDNVKTFFKLQ
jgi:hypothetical protein